VAAARLLPAVARAHGWGRTNTLLYDGSLHVLLNPAFILPIAGIATLASLGGRERLAQVQLALALGVAAGACLAVLGPGWSAVALANRLFIVVAGLLVVLDAAWLRMAVLVLVLLGDALTGHELLVSEPADGNPLWFCTGAMPDAMVLQGGIGGLTLLARPPGRELPCALPAAGSPPSALSIPVSCCCPRSEPAFPDLATFCHIVIGPFSRDNRSVPVMANNNHMASAPSRGDTFSRRYGPGTGTEAGIATKCHIHKLPASRRICRPDQLVQARCFRRTVGPGCLVCGGFSILATAASYSRCVPAFREQASLVPVAVRACFNIQP
jgi:hypothetical protein